MLAAKYQKGISGVSKSHLMVYTCVSLDKLLLMCMSFLTELSAGLNQRLHIKHMGTAPSHL